LLKGHAADNSSPFTVLLVPHQTAHDAVM
jgi:hypothetical protein